MEDKNKSKDKNKNLVVGTTVKSDVYGVGESNGDGTVDFKTGKKKISGNDIEQLLFS